MLNHLSIKNLTLVDQLDLEFQLGMSIVTGETGAGKSIMLGALGLALGDRADSSLISPGADKAEICASFDLDDNPAANAWLIDKQFEDEQGGCILRRVVSKDGRSRAFINGGTVTISELRSLGEMLLDIHSQHEHQSLLKKETHRRLLDEFGGHENQVANLALLFDDYLEQQRELDHLTADAAEQSSRVQLLSYQAQELTKLSPLEGESSSLEIEQKRLAGADITSSKLAEVATLCNNDDEVSAAGLVGRGVTILNSIEDEAIEPVRSMLSEALIQIDEAARDLATIGENFDADPARLEFVEDRLGRIYEIARKHKVDAVDLPDLASQLQAELDEIVNVDERIVEVKSRLETAEKNYQQLAARITSARGKAAPVLEQEVTSRLHGLGMIGASFKINLASVDKPSRFGLDDIEFRIATIPGQDPGSLNKIASGGELSRISLAIQVVTAKTSRTPTLVFDEVDVGVGGATAEVVGSLLRKLGEDAQIICVTHLAQVAAQGHQHYVVTKATTSSGASTTVTKLGEEEKVNEIARMLGGIEQTDQSLAHAESMIAGVENR